VHPLTEIEEITGSRAKALRGGLHDSGNPDTSASCPTEISDLVAEYYAISECGRLFHWRSGIVRECTPDEGRYRIKVDRVCWKITATVLLDRIFPERTINLDAPIDWGSYDPDLPIPGVDDPLAPRNRPPGSRLLDRPPSKNENDRAWRWFYGD